MKNYKIYLINMDRSTERLKRVKGRFKELDLDFERIIGVNASEMQVKDLYARYSVNKSITDFYRALHLGEIGCYISHQNAWKKIVEDDVDFGVVLEDDIKIEDNFEEAIDFLDTHRELWQFARIQNEVKHKKIYNVDYEDKDFKMVEFVRNSGCFFAYAMTKECAKILLENLVPFGAPADTNMHIYDKYGVELKALKPYVISDPIDNDSENVTFKPKKEPRFSAYARVKFNIGAYLIRLSYLLKRDGFFKFSYRLFKMLFAKKLREKNTDV